MEKIRKDEKEAQIVEDLSSVHQKISEDPAKSYDPDADTRTTDDLDEQLRGSDADVDKSIGKAGALATDSPGQRGSDADKDK